MLASRTHQGDQGRAEEDDAAAATDQAQLEAPAARQEKKAL